MTGSEGPAPTRRALSRSQYLGATAALAVTGAMLVVLLGAIFAREGAAPDQGVRESLRFDGSDGGDLARLDQVSGRIEGRDGAARAVRATASEPAVALVDRASDEGRLLVVAEAPVPGWGVVVRWEDPEHHWFVVVAGGGVLRVGYRDGGDPIVVDEAPPLAAGAAVDVRYDPQRVDVRVDGAVVASARGRRVTGRQVGLWASAAGAGWDDLRIGHRPRPRVRPAG